jgi:K+ transporter
MNETKLALSTQGGARHFTYVVEDSKFEWKKLDQCSKIRMKYGYIQLQEVRASMHIVAINGVSCWRAFDFTVVKRYVVLQEVDGVHVIRSGSITT